MPPAEVRRTIAPWAAHGAGCPTSAPLRLRLRFGLGGGLGMPACVRIWCALQETIQMNQLRRLQPVSRLLAELAKRPAMPQEACSWPVTQ